MLQIALFERTLIDWPTHAPRKAPKVYSLRHTNVIPLQSNANNLV